MENNLTAGRLAGSAAFSRFSVLARVHAASSSRRAQPADFPLESAPRRQPRRELPGAENFIRAPPGIPWNVSSSRYSRPKEHLGIARLGSTNREDSTGFRALPPVLPWNPSRVFSSRFFFSGFDLDSFARRVAGIRRSLDLALCNFQRRSSRARRLENTWKSTRVVFGGQKYSMYYILWKVIEANVNTRCANFRKKKISEKFLRR